MAVRINDSVYKMPSTLSGGGKKHTVTLAAGIPIIIVIIIYQMCV